jgi:hypothetical protein
VKVRYAYEHNGQIVHTGTWDTNHKTAAALADALADIPKAKRVDYVLAWGPGNDSNQPDARVRQRAESGVG